MASYSALSAEHMGYAHRVRCAIGGKACEVRFMLMEECSASTRYAVGVVDEWSRELVVPPGMLTVPVGPPSTHEERIQVEQLLGFFSGWLNAPVQLLVDG